MRSYSTPVYRPNGVTVCLKCRDGICSHRPGICCRRSSLCRRDCNRTHHEFAPLHRIGTGHVVWLHRLEDNPSTNSRDVFHAIPSVENFRTSSIATRNRNCPFKHARFHTLLRSSEVLRG